MKQIITLDGPAGSGKSTVAVQLATHFQLPMIDTGAMYRTIAWQALAKGIAVTDESRLVEEAMNSRFRFGFQNKIPFVEMSFRGGVFKRIGSEIRMPQVSTASSDVARLKKLREVLVHQQRAIGLENGGVIEGRDAGTMIFPDAKVKFYLTATPEVRAERRYKELAERFGDRTPSWNEVYQDLLTRDQQDQSRAHSPLKPAPDAIVIETTSMTYDEVLFRLIAEVKRICGIKY